MKIIGYTKIQTQTFIPELFLLLAHHKENSVKYLDKYMSTLGRILV